MIRPGLTFLRLLLLICVAGVVAGCAAPRKIGPDSETVFQRTGRFSVTVKAFSGVPDAVQGGFSWRDSGSMLTLDLANPLGSTLARITVQDGIAVLTHSNGVQEYADDADGLAEKALGSPVPVSGLRDWLRGQTGPAPAHEQHTDDTGRLTAFTQDGWRVRLSRYDSQGPTVLQMNRRDAQRDVSVRLVVTPEPDAL